MSWLLNVACARLPAEAAAVVRLGEPVRLALRGSLVMLTWGDTCYVLGVHATQALVDEAYSLGWTVATEAGNPIMPRRE